MVFRAGAELFRTGWFVESLLTELVIALVVRTRRPVLPQPAGHACCCGRRWRSIALTFAMPYLPLVGVFGFVPLAGRAARHGRGDHRALRRRDGSHSRSGSIEASHEEHLVDADRRAVHAAGPALRAGARARRQSRNQDVPDQWPRSSIWRADTPGAAGVRRPLPATRSSCRSGSTRRADQVSMRATP